jgi:catechol 2,3-dioxygenase
VLGLPLISRDEGVALLGIDARRPSLELSAIDAPTPLSPHTSGLFHVAWLHPTRAALADTVLRIADARWPIEGASDHGVSESLYLSDPDGLGIEVYADRPRERWQRPADGRGVVMFTAALDLDDLIEQASAGRGGGANSSVAPGTSIGHVHLKVSDVERAIAFYRDSLGFEEQARLPSAGFLSAGGYHHHIGVNSWQSQGAAGPPASAPQLLEIDFELEHASAQTLSDPDGIELRFARAGASEPLGAR